jgi:hypothetical protein
VLIGVQTDFRKKSKSQSIKRRMSGRTRQATALRSVIFNQLYDLGLKCILRGVNSAYRFSERLLLKFLLDRQAEFRELFDIRS